MTVILQFLVVPNLRPATLTLPVAIIDKRFPINHLLEIDPTLESRMVVDDMFNVQKVHGRSGPSDLVNPIKWSVKIKAHFIENGVAHYKTSK